MTKKEMVTEMVNDGWYELIVQDYSEQGYQIEHAKRKAIDYIVRNKAKAEIQIDYVYYEMECDCNADCEYWESQGY